MDQFNESYFIKISKEDREKVKQWLKDQYARWRKEREFLGLVKQAVRKIDYDYWIAVSEPTISYGKMFFVPTQSICVGISCSEWEQMARAYNPNRKSRLATLYELILWYVIQIVNESKACNSSKNPQKLVILKNKFILSSTVYKGKEESSYVVDICDNIDPDCILNYATGAVVLTK